MNIFIISGANGFLGNNIIRALQNKENTQIRAIVVKNHNTKPLEGLKADIYYASVENYESLNDAFKVKESDNVFVIHCAAKVYIDDKKLDSLMDVNVNGTKNMLEHTKKVNGRFIFVSSSSVFYHKRKNEIINENSLIDLSKTKSPYEKSKIIAGQLVDAYYKDGLDAVTVYPSSIFGPYDYKNMFVETMINEIIKGNLNASITGSYDFVDVRDVSDAIIKLCDKGKKGEKYIISNKEIHVSLLMNNVCELLNKKKIKFICNNSVASIFLPFYKVFSKNKTLSSLFNKESLKVLKYGANLDNSKLKSTIDFVPHDLNQSLRETIDFLKKYNNL